MTSSRHFHPVALIYSSCWYSYCCLLLLLSVVKANAWVQNVPAKITFQYKEESFDRFSGSESNPALFKLLQLEHSSALIGARNVMYNVSLSTLTEFTEKRISWDPETAHKELCFLKGKSEDDCQNYIRIGARINDEEILLCGTNAFRPYCRTYLLKDNGLEAQMLKKFDGTGWCQFDPNHNSSAIYTDGQLYSATVADFSGVDPLIYRTPLRTERSDLKQLNEPQFVSSVTYGDYVLFFFREAAVEYINCGKAVYSRVGRVCKHDKGGPHQFGDRWTSFLKSRLNCSVPGDYPFYFNEIQSTSEVVDSKTGKKLLYAVFTTPDNSIGGSAVCAFSMDDIMNTFSGPFKEQSSMNSNWLRVPPSKVPKFSETGSKRPGECVEDSRTLPDVAVHFIKSHSLMDDAVPSFYNMPLLVRISWQYRFTAVTVDPQVIAANGNAYDVIFIGTDDGRIIKFVNVDYEPDVRTVVIEEIQVLPTNVPVRSLNVVRVDHDTLVDKLLIVSDNEVLNLPLHRCNSSKITRCEQCIGLQDPYCAWDRGEDKCVVVNQYIGNKKLLLQNVTRGQHNLCKPPHVVSAVAEKPLERELIGDRVKDVNCPKCSYCSPTPCQSESGEPPQEKIVIYTPDTLGMVVATAVLATLVVGFVAGYLFSRHYSQMPFTHTHHQLNRLAGENLNAESSSYLPPCANNKPAINLVLNVPPKNANDKNANSSNDNKPIQKVKKTYI